MNGACGFGQPPGKSGLRLSVYNNLIASWRGDRSIMGLPKPEPLFTVDEYLTFERSSKEKHEFFDGHIYAMAGESGEPENCWPRLAA